MKGNNVLVIGGSKGVSRALVEKLTESGANVHVALRDPNAVHKQVASKQSMDATQEFSLEIPDVLDAVVYCPGSITLKPFHRLTVDDVQADVNVNAVGAFKVIQQALPALKKSQASGGAAVVLFSSVAAQIGLPFHASISMAKAALEGLTVALAAELAPSGIRVNAISPSITDTPLAEHLLNSDVKKNAAAERHPLKRIGNAEGMASLAAYLLSEDAAFVTGQVFKADGGMSALR